MDALSKETLQIVKLKHWSFQLFISCILYQSQLTQDVLFAQAFIDVF
jgi:hypothetical protein